MRWEVTTFLDLQHRLLCWRDQEIVFYTFFEKKTISVKQQDAYDFFSRASWTVSLLTTIGIHFTFGRDRHLLCIDQCQIPR